MKRMFATVAFLAVSATAAIQTPSQFLGIDVGSDRVLADYRQIASYFADRAKDTKLEPRILLTEGDAGFAKVVGGHFDIYLVANTDADEMFAHFAGDMREDFMTVG